MNGTVTPLARTADQLHNLLEDIALGRGQFSWAAVRAMAWNGHTYESLTEAWDDFRQGVRALAALETGTRTWQEFYEPEDCGSHEHAIELKSGEIHDAFNALVNGPRRPEPPRITVGSIVYGQVGANPAVVHASYGCAVSWDYDFGFRPLRVSADDLAMIEAGQRMVACSECAGGAR